MSTRVKMCGMVHPADAEAAARAGADAIGVIQVPGAKRCVTTETAEAIVQGMPPAVVSVLVFAGASAEGMRWAVQATGAGTIQLHGLRDTDPEISRVSVIRRVEVTARLAEDLAGLPSGLAGVLLEAPGGGGTGMETDWDVLAQGLEAVDRRPLPPIWLAGGLTPGNVGAVVRRFRPDGVDVSSGISRAGELRKDPELIAAFMDAVRSA